MINFLLGLFIGITMVNLTVLIYMIKTNDGKNGAVIAMGIYYWIIVLIGFIFRQIRNIIIKNFQVIIVLKYSCLEENNESSREHRIFFREWRRNLKNYKINSLQVFNLSEDERCIGRFQVQTDKENENIIYKLMIKNLHNSDKYIVKKFLAHIENQKS